jgi:hypothetical protein
MEHIVPLPYINTKFKNFVEIPVRALKWLMTKLKISSLFKKHIKEARQSKSCYSLDSLLMSGLMVPLFRQPSRHQFYQHLFLPNAQIDNLAHFSGIKDKKFPSSRTLEDNYQLLKPSQMQDVLFDLFANLIKSKVFTNHPSLLSHGRTLLAIDAFWIHTYQPLSQHPCRHCPFCLKRQIGDKIRYLHLIVVASVVSPCGFQFPLFLHRVRKEVADISSSDQSFKEECELSSFPIILKAIRHRFPKLKFTLLLDSLYANGPVLDLCQELKFDYRIVRKPGSFSSLTQEIEGLQKSSNNRESVVSKIATNRFRIFQSIQFFNHLSLPNREVNIIDLQEICQKKPSKRFAKIHQKISHWQWIVPSILNGENVISFAKQSRQRWKIEDLGNTLKNRGFNLKHDFSRHPVSQSIWLYLQLIAYALTSLFLLSEIGASCRKKYTVFFLMSQMLEDLVRCSFTTLFHFSPFPQLLRFFVFPNAG